MVSKGVSAGLGLLLSGLHLACLLLISVGVLDLLRLGIWRSYDEQLQFVRAGDSLAIAGSIAGTLPFGCGGIGFWKTHLYARMSGSVLTLFLLRFSIVTLLLLRVVQVFLFILVPWMNSSGRHRWLPGHFQGSC